LEEIRMQSRNRLRQWAVLALAAAALLGSAGRSVANDGHNRLEARLRGFDETPLAISTPAKGRFAAHYDEASKSISYELSYSGLAGDVRQAHIHFGKRGVSGGIMVWLCQTSFNVDPTGLSPTCPQSGTVTGVIQAANVIGPSAQGIDPLEFDEMVKAIRSSTGYVNVHSSKYPSGEIRGQLGRDD
jgi:hypothetical protein